MKPAAGPAPARNGIGTRAGRARTARGGSPVSTSVGPTQADPYSSYRSRSATESASLVVAEAIEMILRLILNKCHLSDAGAARQRETAEILSAGLAAS
jgi:hypothetical protein